MAPETERSPEEIAAIEASRIEDPEKAQEMAQTAQYSYSQLAEIQALKSMYQELGLEEQISKVDTTLGIINKRVEQEMDTVAENFDIRKYSKVEAQAALKICEQENHRLALFTAQLEKFVLPELKEDSRRPAVEKRLEELKNESLHWKYRTEKITTHLSRIEQG